MFDRKLKILELLKLSLRTFRTKPQRAFLTIMGMSIGIATVLLLVSLGYGLQYILIGKLMTTEDSLVTMEIAYPSESNLVVKPELLDKLKSYEDVAEISTIAEFPGELSTENASGLLVDTKIVEPSYFRMSGVLPSLGKPFEKNDGIVVSSQTLTAQGLGIDESSLGKIFNLKVFFQDPSTVDSVTGAVLDTTITKESLLKEPLMLKGVIVDESMAPTVIIPLEALSVPPPFYGRVLVKAKNVEVLERLRDKLLGEGFLVSARIDLITQARKITNIITTVLGVFGVTALIISAIGMFNTMLVGFLERIYEVGILKSLGATDHDVRNLFLIEAAIMGFFGGAGGVLMGFGMGKLLNFSISMLAVHFGGDPIDLFMTPFWFILLSMIFSIFIGVISGWLPAHRAAGLSPKEAFTRK